MKLCFIMNIATHYDAPIYKLLDEHYDVSWYFGDNAGGIKTLDPSFFKGEYHQSQTKNLVGGWYYQQGVPSLISKDFDRYIILGETRSLSTWLFLFRSLFHRKKKVFAWSHGWYGKETKLETFLKKIFFKMPNGGVILYGNYARNLMIKEGFNPEKLFVRHNSLDHSKQAELRNSGLASDIYKNHFQNDNPVIVMIGRLNARKHLDMLIDAMAILRSKGHGYNAVLIGDGEDRTRLETLAKENNLSENIWFYGACYDEKENAELVYNSDLCVLPGDVGLTAMHTMTFGVPLISHNHFPFHGPEHEAIIPGMTGDFYEYGDVNSLATTIQNWFEAHTDREAIRLACYKEIDENWTPEYQFGVISNAIENK